MVTSLTPQRTLESLFSLLCSLGLILSTCYVLIGCGATPPPHRGLNAQTQASQNELGPILGALTKEKVVDRLRGYPACGMPDEPQKQTLMVRPHKIEEGLFVVEIECFFLGVQGLFEYFFIRLSDGRLIPLSFDGALPLTTPANREERASPINLNQGRHEVCGVPQFDLKSKKLTTLCKGTSAGGCGAYAEYVLDLEHIPPRFAVTRAHFNSCETPSQKPPTEWPKTSF